MAIISSSIEKAFPNSDAPAGERDAADVEKLLVKLPPELPVIASNDIPGLEKLFTV